MLKSYLGASNQQALLAPQPPIAQLAPQGAPLLGMDYRNNMVASRPQTCLSMGNFLCTTNSVEVRKGYRKWQDALDTAIGTLMPYNHPTSASSRLFAVSDSGIFNITTRTNNGGVTPARALNWGSVVVGRTRFASFVQYFTSVAPYLCVVCSGNGYYTYDAAGGWVNHPAGAGAGQINGTSPTNFDFVFSWKSRLWFVKDGESVAWYLPVNAIAGTVNSFDFGPTFLNGGAIACMVSISVDGGIGIDDHLAVISTKGDVSIWKGTDPSALSTFAIVGRWSLGSVPAGRRFATAYGSDALVLTTKGLTSLAALMRGQTIGQAMFESVSAPVDPVLHDEIVAGQTSYGWELFQQRVDNQLMITVPQSSTTTWKAYMMHMLNNAWSSIYSMPCYTHAMFNDFCYASDRAGNVYQTFYGITDDVGFSDTNNIIPEAYVQTNFESYESGEVYKMFRLLTVIFMAGVEPAVNARIVKEFSVASPPGTASIPPVITGSLWGSGLWGTATWYSASVSAPNTYIGRLGLNSMAYYAALLMSVTAYGGSKFVSYTVAYEKGSSML